MPHLIDVQNRKKPELLAPAGSLEAFFAAMEKGADAVYAGLREFSARAKAKNFTLHQLERMLAYAHERGRRMFVTLNTLVKERELPLLVETLSALEGMGVDGVIIQDLAVYRLVRDYFPAIPIHASTQMTIHNTAGVQQLATMGFRRVVLARELHIDEIRNIVRATDMEIECFIHGALCFSVSGQCYFSSFLGGHSGNRGRCTQPCRRQYKYRGKEGYYFSTNDFSSIDMLPQLIDAGVTSLKIEGRMKSAEYVACVVEAYRMALDAPERKRAEAVAAAKDLLKLSFGRVPTRGFLDTHTPTDIAIPTLKGSTGRFLGEIKSIAGSSITFASKDRLHVGDRIRVQPKSDKAGRAFTIKELYRGKQNVMVVQAHEVVTIPSPFPFKVGDAVFKVSSETAFTMSENACLKKLESVHGEKTPCELSLAMHGATMKITARLAGTEFNMDFLLGDLEAGRTEDMAGVFIAQFAKTGDTPFALAALSAPDFPALAISPARLKEIRRAFYQALAERILPQLKRVRLEAKKRALAGLLPSGVPRSVRREELTIRLESIRDYHLLHQEGIDTIILPVTKANLHQLQPFVRKLKGREDNVIWHLPFIIFDGDYPFFREAVSYLTDFGFRRFEVANMSHFALLQGHNVELSTDYRLFSLNSQALLCWEELGATAATLYIEDDGENMAEILCSDVPLRKRVLVYGAVPAITSKIKIKDVRNDVPVFSDRGDGYIVTQKNGLTVITPTRMFSLVEFREKLKSMGCDSFIIDLSAEPLERRKWVLEAFARGAKLEGTSEFNFTMGLV